MTREQARRLWGKRVLWVAGLHLVAGFLLPVVPENGSNMLPAAAVTAPSVALSSPAGRAEPEPEPEGGLLRSEARTRRGRGPAGRNVAPAATAAERTPAQPAPAQPTPAHTAPALATPSPVQPVAAAGRVPVLMYHEIAHGPNTLYVPPEELAAHLAYLAKHQYHTVTLQQVYDAFQDGTPLPERPIVLTFDDGYRSFYTAAFPLLQKHGFVATLFVITGSVGEPNFITWDQAREMAAAGIEMGAHTVSHPDLPTSSAARVRDEITRSRAVLEQELGQPVRFFAYPAGRHDERALAALREAGYLGAVTTARGPATPQQSPLLWKRLRINTGTSTENLAWHLNWAAKVEQ